MARTPSPSSRTEPKRTAPGGVLRWLRAPAVLLVLAWLWPAPWEAARAQDPGPANIPDLTAALRLQEAQHFCGEPVPLEDPETRERMEKEMLLTLWNRPQVLLWLKRSSRYFPAIRPVLETAGLPGDLVYLAVVESALRPHAVSGKGATGFWQFTAGTARRYGLTVDARRDERRSLAASTGAAARYLRDLHQMFGSWTLAAAAYNMGEEGLQAEILHQGTADYYRLYLPLETQRFVFRILAVKRILEAPERYGFHLEPDDYYPPLVTDTVEVDVREETPLRLVAAAAGTDFKAVKDLNPEVRGHFLARGVHRLQVPREGAEGFHGRFRAAVERHRSARKERIYVVQKGDNLSAIADRYGVSLAALLIWNRIDPRRPIHPGQAIQIPTEPSESGSPPAEGVETE